MLLARILDAMFDPEERKKRMEKAKRDAMDRVKLPPLTGYHSTGGETTDGANVIDSDRVWLHYFTMSESIRNAHGVKTVDGKWEIEDRKKFESLMTESRKFLLRPHWKK